MSQEKKLSVTRALVELKLLDARILKPQRNPMATLIVNSKAIFQDLDVIDTKAFLDSKNALVSRRAKIKLAIMLSNITTKVIINGETMSVLEAIERKTTIHYEENQVEHLKRILLTISMKVDSHNRESKKVLDTLLNAAASGGTLDESTAESITKNHNKLNLMTIQYGKLNLPTQIGIMEESIEEFKSEVDFILSASNATTEIEID